MIYTISALKDFLKCPQYCYNAHELRRIGKGISPKLEVGTLFHEAVAIKLRDGAGTKGLGLPSWPEVSAEARALWEKHELWLPINNLKIPDSWDIRHVEVALKGPVVGIELHGRLDAIVKYNGKYWSLQWKTYEDHLDTLLERVRLGWHEAAYQHLAELEGFRPWGGTILGACQKLPSYRILPAIGNVPRTKYMVTDQDRINALTFHYLARSPQAQSRMMMDLKWYLAGMVNHFGHINLTAVGGEKITVSRSNGQARNYDSCWGPFGNSRCPYYSTCHEGADIGSEQFTDAPKRYDA